MKILIIRYSSLGDIVISTSVLKAIYDHFPGARIDFLTEKRYIPLLKSCPYAGNVIGFNRNSERFYEYLHLAKCLDRYDIVFDLQNKLFSFIVAQTVSRGKIYRFYKRYVSEVKLSVHILDLYSRFLGNAGIEMKDKRYFLSYGRKRQDKLIGINIEGGHLSKRLSRAQLFGITESLTNKGFEVILIGTMVSKSLARDIMCRFRNVREITSRGVDGLIDTISALSVLITPDSGPLHIASALKVPSVAIFGSTSYTKWLLQSENVSLVKSDYKCSPCSEYGTSICRAMKSFGCMRSISADIIVSEALRLYEQDKKEN
ncbi:MAG: glycosyltransferase family 9 protein [Deltaproteobacteria bacterium]|nr:glycosyltransferase family 9 protein [Deltaproteobacteria bacterium]